MVSVNRMPRPTQNTHHTNPQTKPSQPIHNFYSFADLASAALLHISWHCLDLMVGWERRRYLYPFSFLPNSYLEHSILTSQQTSLSTPLKALELFPLISLRFFEKLSFQAPLACLVDHKPNTTYTWMATNCQTSPCNLRVGQRLALAWSCAWELQQTSLFGCYTDDRDTTVYR